MNSNPVERVLVLDDDTAIRESLMLYLEDSQLEAISASSVDEALAMLEQAPCDIAIVDLRLPGKTGEEFILEVHSDWPQMKFIIHTGSSDYCISPQLLNIGMQEQDIFIKPINDLQQLVGKVRSLRQSSAN